MVKRLGIFTFILISILVFLYGYKLSTNQVIEAAILVKMSPYKLPIFLLWSLLVCFINFPLGVVTKLLSGWLFGFGAGFSIVYFGTISGAYLAFRFARYMGQEYVERWFGASMKKLNSKLIQNELISLVQIRIFPFIPLPVANICLGVTGVSDANFLISSLLGILPATLFYAYLGSQIHAISYETLDFNNFLPYYIYIIAALIFSLLLPLIHRKLTKRGPSPS